MPLVTGGHPDTEPLTTILWVRPSRQFLTHLTVHPSKSESLQLRGKDVVGYCVKGVIEVHVVDNVHSPSFVPLCSNSTREVGEVGLSVGEAVLAVSNHFLIHHVP